MADSSVGWRVSTKPLCQGSDASAHIAPRSAGAKRATAYVSDANKTDVRHTRIGGLRATIGESTLTGVHSGMRLAGKISVFQAPLPSLDSLIYRVEGGLPTSNPRGAQWNDREFVLHSSRTADTHQVGGLEPARDALQDMVNRSWRSAIPFHRGDRRTWGPTHASGQAGRHRASARRQPPPAGRDQLLSAPSGRAWRRSSDRCPPHRVRGMEYARSKRNLRTTSLPLPTPMSAGAVKKVRAALRASQAVFARYLNVSTKLVQAWEANRRKPEGPALVLLHIVAKQPQVIEKALLRASAGHSSQPRASHAKRQRPQRRRPLTQQGA